MLCCGRPVTYASCIAKAATLVIQYNRLARQTGFLHAIAPDIRPSTMHQTTFKLAFIPAGGYAVRHHKRHSCC